MSEDIFSAALRDPQAALPPDIACISGADLAARFGVYRNNGIVSLIASLEQSYPVVATLVGEDFFREMARRFARAHPPVSPVMYDYGAPFSDFILSYEPASRVPYLSDIARLEWQAGVALHAADATSLDLGEVSRLLASPETLAILRWEFHPTVSLIASHYAIVSLWRAHQHDSLERITQEIAQIDLNQAETGLIVRPNLKVEVYGLHSVQGVFVQSLIQGNSLTDASAEAFTQDPSFDLAEMMGDLFRMKVFKDVWKGDEQMSGLK